MNSDQNFFRSFQDIFLNGFKSDEYSLTRELTVFAVWFSLFVLTMYVLIAYNPQQGVHTNVSFHMFQQLITQIANSNPRFGLAANWLIYGSTDFPVNARLMPAYVVSIRFPPVMVPIIAFTIFSAELFIALYVSCRLFRLPVYTSLIAGWLVGLLYMPVIAPRLVVIEIMKEASFQSTFAGMFILSVALFYRLGKSGNRHTFYISCGLFLIASYVTLAFQKFVLIYGYNLFWTCLPLFIFATSMRERKVKLVSGAVLCVFYYLIFYDYLSAFYHFNYGDIIRDNTRGIGDLFTTTWQNLKAAFQSLDAFLDTFSIKDFTLRKHAESSRFMLYFLYTSIASGFFYAVVFANRFKSNVFQISASFLGGLFGYSIWKWGYHEAVISPFYLMSFVLGVSGAVHLMTHALKKGLLSLRAPAQLVNDGIWIKGGFLVGVRRGFDIAVPVVTLRGIAFMVFAVPFALYFAYRLLINPDMSFLYVYGKKPDLEISRILKEDLSISYSPYFRGRLANLAVIDTPGRFI